MFPAGWLTTSAFRVICTVIPAICDFGVYLIADEDTYLDNTDRLSIYMGHFPAGTSLKCLVHYAQIINAAKF